MLRPRLPLQACRHDLPRASSGRQRKPMRTSDCDILMVPGLGGSGPDHWQSRWERQLSTARRVEQAAGTNPPERLGRPHRQGGRPVQAPGRSRRPLPRRGAVAHAAAGLAGPRVRGAFLVGLPDVENPDLVPGVDDFGPIPRDPLPFPSVLIASRTDPYCAFDKRARTWPIRGARRSSMRGTPGHVNTEIGHGPWPEGLMRFAGFLKRLQPA